MPEIHEQAESVAGGVEIIEHLGTMLIRQRRHRLDLQDDLLEADEIRLESLTKRPAFVAQWQMRLRRERNALQTQLNFQTLLIDGLSEAATFLVIDLKARPLDPEALVFIEVEDVTHSVFMIRVICAIRGLTSFTSESVSSLNCKIMLISPGRPGGRRAWLLRLWSGLWRRRL